MRRTRILLLLAASTLSACGGDGSNCASPSEEYGTAFQQWSTAVEDARVCQTNEDCATYEGETVCLRGCGVAVNESEIERLQSIESDLQARIDTCEAGPCPVPTCAPRPSGVACIEQRCEFSDAQ